MSDKMTPNVRFKGFTDAWEQRKLGDLVQIQSGYAPSEMNLTDNSRDPMYIKVDDLNHSSREQFTSEAHAQTNAKMKMATQGATIFAKRGAAIMTNKVRILAKDAYMDTNMMALEPAHIDGSFLFSIINRVGLYKIADTSTIPQINNKHILPYVIALPSIGEQRKISSFLKCLDDIIVHHQKKLEDLQQLKKLFLQKIFDQEWRFQGFSDPWEQRKLGEILENLVSGVSVNSSDEKTGNFILKTSAIKSGKVDLTEVKAIVPSDLGRAKTAIVKNSIIISRMNTPQLVGASGLVTKSKKNIFLPDRLWQGQVNASFSAKWLIQSINTAPNLWKIHALANGTSGSMKNISKKSMLEFRLKAPKKEEQEKIGEFLADIDDTIAHHQKKLDQLKQLKKWFLQNMFV